MGFNEIGFPGKTNFAIIESDSDIFFVLNESGSEIELQNTESVVDTNTISDVSELQNGDLGGKPETLVTERSDESVHKFHRIVRLCILRLVTDEKLSRLIDTPQGRAAICLTICVRLSSMKMKRLHNIVITLIMSYRKALKKRFIH